MSSRGFFKQAALLAALLCLSPAPVTAQESLWRSYYCAAQQSYETRDFQIAKTMLQAAYKCATISDESLSTLFYLARVYEKTGELSDAADCYKKMLDVLGTKTWTVVRPPEGTPDWDHAGVREVQDVDLFRAVLVKKPPKILATRFAKPITIVDVLSDYGSLLQALNRNREAESIYKEALYLSDSRPERASEYQISVLQKLGDLYKTENRGGEMDAVLQQAARLRNTQSTDFEQIVNHTMFSLDKLRRRPDSLAIRFNNLALFCASHGDYARAQSLFDKALTCVTETGGNKRDLLVSTIVGNYADLLLAMGKFSEATNLQHQFFVKAPTMKVSQQPSSPK